jgi:hypothetical protein
MALCIGLPVSRSQTTQVSRWLVMPIAATSVGTIPAPAKASRATISWVCQITSRHAPPTRVWIDLANSSLPDRDVVRLNLSNMMARALDVPSSRPSRKFSGH